MTECRVGLRWTRNDGRRVREARRDFVAENETRSAAPARGAHKGARPRLARRSDRAAAPRAGARQIVAGCSARRRRAPHPARGTRHGDEGARTGLARSGRDRVARRRPAPRGSSSDEACELREVARRASAALVGARVTPEAAPRVCAASAHPPPRSPPRSSSSHGVASRARARVVVVAWRPTVRMARLPAAVAPSSRHRQPPRRAAARAVKVRLGAKSGDAARRGPRAPRRRARRAARRRVGGSPVTDGARARRRPLSASPAASDACGRARRSAGVAAARVETSRARGARVSARAAAPLPSAALPCGSAADGWMSARTLSTTARRCAGALLDAPRASRGASTVTLPSYRRHPRSARAEQVGDRCSSTRGRETNAVRRASATAR